MVVFEIENGEIQSLLELVQTFTEFPMIPMFVAWNILHTCSNFAFTTFVKPTSLQQTRELPSGNLFDSLNRQHLCFLHFIVHKKERGLPIAQLIQDVVAWWNSVLEMLKKNLIEKRDFALLFG